MIIKRTPEDVPKKCFGLEYAAADKTCVDCEFKSNCVKFMGKRLNRVPVDKALFDTVPKEYKRSGMIPARDPEAENVHKLYCSCYFTVYGDFPADSAKSISSEIVTAAERAGYSMRLFILSNILGYTVMQKERAKISGFIKNTKFSASMLLDPKAVTRAQMYEKICTDTYGTFSTGALTSLESSEIEGNSLEQRMLNSEIIAGTHMIGSKLRYLPPAYDSLFEEREFDLDPHWLAIENYYVDNVLKPYLQNKRGTDKLKNHRFNVVQVHCYFKRHPSAAPALFKIRQEIVPKAVHHVLNLIRYHPSNFLVERVPFTDILNFWEYLARAVMQDQVNRFYSRQHEEIYDSE